jgi:hypothetical protein
MAPDIRMEITVKMFNSAYKRMYTTKTIQRMMIKAIWVWESFLRAIFVVNVLMHKDKKKAQISHLYLLKT